MTGELEEGLRRLYEERFAEPVASLSPLKGDGSGRTLLRLQSATRTVVGAHGPDRKENEAFLGFSRHFRRCGLPVPEIYAERLDEGLYLEEDLGDTTLFSLLSQRRSESGVPEDVAAVYEKVVEELPRFQLVAGKSLDYSLCYPRASFDEQSMRWDLNYFKYYFLRLAGVPFSEQALEDDFKRFVKYLLGAPRKHFLYRDFQSRNVMVRDGKPWFIDYQGGRKGALQYDVASLLFDAKADLPFDFRDRLLERYLDAASKLAPIDKTEFLAHYPGFVYIRIMQAMGAYGLRGFYERKTRFLQSIPYAVRNLEHLLRTTKLPVELPELMKVFQRLTASSALRQFGDAQLKLTVRIQSFSYRNGMPADERGHGGGFVFDCRALPNPGKFERYKRSTGVDPDVVEFLEKEPAVGRFLDGAAALVEQSVESYRERNFTDLFVAFGCTGGQHRSVYCADVLARRLTRRFGDAVAVEVRHREQEKGHPALHGA